PRLPSAQFRSPRAESEALRPRLPPDAADRRSRAGVPEPRQAPGVLDRSQEAVLVRRLREPRAPLHGRSERERLDATASAGVARSLVEDDEDDTATQLRRMQQRNDPRLQPGVAGGGRAVVHVVAEVGDDEREVGQPVPREVTRKPGERDDTRAPRTRADDVAEVEERVVLLRVAA